MKQTRLSFFLLLISSILPLAAFAQAVSLDLNAKLPFDLKVRTGKLPNGLTYYIRQNSKPEHRAELRLVIHAGSILEDDDQQGLAHLNEHMCFNGTTKYPHNTLESFLELHGARFGADLNASTSFDETIYKETLPTDQGAVLDSGIDILCEWAHNVTFDSVELEKERGVVGEEWRLGRGAQERISNKQAPIIFYGSEYAKRSPIGLKPVIDTAHRSTVTKFYHDWYRPDLMAVIVVGDIDPSKIEQQIKTLFSPLRNPTNERTRKEFPVPAHKETLATVNSDKEMTQTIFTMHYKRPSTDEITVGDYRKQIITALYDQMLNDRIQELIQTGNAAFAFAGAGDSKFLGNLRSFNVFALLRQDSISQGITTALREVYRAEKTGFGLGELDRAKKSLMSQFEKQYAERDKTKSANYVREYISNFTQREPVPGIEFEYELYKQYMFGVKLSEVNALSAELLGHASRVMTLSAPESKDVTLPSKDDLLKILAEVEKEQLAAYNDKASNAPLMASLPKPGKIVKEKNLSNIGVTEWQLSNGARVIVKPTDFKDDEILFHAIAPGGTSIVPDPDYMSADNADGIIENSGLADFDATTLKKMLAGKEADVSPSISSLREGLEGHSTKKDIETLFQLANLYMTHPRLDSVAAASSITRIKSLLQNRSKQPESAFSDTLEVTMTQNNFRSRPPSSTQLDEVSITKAYDFYKKLFSDASDFTFYFVGNVDTNSLKSLSEKYLASLPSSDQHVKWKDEGITPPKGVIVKTVYKGTEPKSRVSIVYTGKMKFSRENRFKLSAMAQAFSIVLREDLREDKSGVYSIGARATLEQYPHGHYSITISFGCDPARVDELAGEVMKQVDTLVSKPIEATYVDRVKKILSNELETNMKENGYWMNWLQDADWNGIDPALISHGTELINSLTPDLVFKTAKEYFDRKNCVEVVLYPEKKS